MTSHRSPVLVPYLIAALRANAPLPENGDALARLQERVAAAALPPGPGPVRPLPPLAREISGRTFALAPNSLGIESLSLRFETAAAEAWLSITLAGTASRPAGSFGLLVGLDGEYRISDSGPSNLPVGVRGLWDADGSFVMRYSEVAGMNNFTIRAIFENDGLTLEVEDPTGYFGQVISGRATDGD